MGTTYRDDHDDLADHDGFPRDGQSAMLNARIEARQDPLTLLRVARICARKGGAWENQRYGALRQRIVSPVNLPDLRGAA